MEISLFLKEHDTDFVTLNETWLRSKWCGNAAIIVRSYIKFDILDTRSSIHTDNEIFNRLTNFNKHKHILPASLINITVLNNIKDSARDVFITGVLNAKHSTSTVLWQINGI